MEQKQPINLETWGDLARHGYKVSVHCRICDRHVMLDLEQIPAAKPYLGSRLRCSQCGKQDTGISLMAPTRSI